jgi:hypothetical protein
MTRTARIRPGAIVRAPFGPGKSLAQRQPSAAGKRMKKGISRRGAEHAEIDGRRGRAGADGVFITQPMLTYDSTPIFLCVLSASA